MRVLIVRATGHVASRLIPTLLATEMTVVASAREPLEFDWRRGALRLIVDVVEITP